MNNRRTLYFSQRYDKDLVEVVDGLEDQMNFQDIVKGLMRDGLKFRENKGVLQSNTIRNKPNLQSVQIKKKELDRIELEDRLDMF